MQRGHTADVTRFPGSVVRPTGPGFAGQGGAGGALGTGEASKRVEERSRSFEGLIAGHRGSPRLPAGPPGVSEIGEDIASPHGFQAVWPHGNVWSGGAMVQTITVSAEGGNLGEESRIDARVQRVAGRSPAIDKSPGMTSEHRATGSREVVWRYKVEVSARADRNPQVLRCSAGERHTGVSFGLSVPGGASRLYTIGAGPHPRKRWEGHALAWSLGASPRSRIGVCPGMACQILRSSGTRIPRRGSGPFGPSPEQHPQGFADLPCSQGLVGHRDPAS
jgi:hypothetical protein